MSDSQKVIPPVPAASSTQRRIKWNEIGAPYEAAVARLGLGYATRLEGQEERARLEFRAACTIFERIGAQSQAARAAGALRDAQHGDPEVAPIAATVIVERQPLEDNVFRAEGDYWAVVFDGRVARVRDSKGLRYLSRLLAEPGREFHVLDLVALERTPDNPKPVSRFSTAGDAGELLDARAKAAYRRRLAEIDEDVAEALTVGDPARAAGAEGERDILMRELSRAVGLGGRDRRAGSADERARSAVTRAMRHALGRIRAHHAGLGDHLDRTIRTGTYCVYLPDGRFPIAWNG
jgi:hypothetical protein